MAKYNNSFGNVAHFNYQSKMAVRFFTKGKLLFLFFSLIGSLCWSQDIDINDSTKTRNPVESLLIDRDLRNWSVRLLGNVKGQGFRLSNDNARLSYVPNNLFGIGVGVATRKLILDIAFNLKDKSTERTDRFDLRGGFIAKNNVIDFYLQRYKGFNIENSINATSIFRDDVKSIAFGIDYLYLFKSDEYSINLLRSGLSDQKQSTFSFGLGGFMVYNQINADNSLVPLELYPFFNEQARIIDFTNYGIGVMGGLVSLIKLPSNFYFGLSARAGIGLTIKNAEAEAVSYNPKNPMIYKIKAFALFGYKWERFYTNITFGASTNRSSLGYGNNGSFSLLDGKLAVGYKIKGSKKPVN
ncbi:DUF4421 family protein [uncultured Eudoraea sp.]|uniref:DUF4421 family protein n=1 Tax=uncultured Eudoraea sp. TaxID=1035614 RepID=UPI00260DB5E0|nr:DUF4421 family protein [uncultured Eudoraea sp.]